MNEKPEPRLDKPAKAGILSASRLNSHYLIFLRHLSFYEGDQCAGSPDSSNGWLTSLSSQLKFIRYAYHQAHSNAQSRILYPRDQWERPQSQSRYDFHLCASFHTGA